jgi:hypothetical protein
VTYRRHRAGHPGRHQAGARDRPAAPAGGG